MTRPWWKRWVFILIGGLFLALILSMGLFVRLQSVAAVKQLVERLSNGKYVFNAKTIRVDPLHMIVRARGLHIQPLHPGETNNEFELRADSLSLKLTHVLKLIFLKQLNVDNFTVVNPSLTMKVYDKDSTHRKKEPVPLHIQVSRMQEVFFNVLQSLQVRHFKLQNGAVVYYPDYKETHSRYFLNHINLNIDDLNLVRRISEWDKENRVAIRFELKKPVIAYPDSSIVVNLDGLIWDSKARKFDLSGLGFHKRIGDEEDSSGFRLDGIELDSLNWNKLLTEGSVELGELKAAKGYFSSNDIRLKRNNDSTQVKPEGNLLDVIGPILIKKLSIYQIEFTGNTHTKRGKESLQINGEQFMVKNLIIDKKLPHKIELEELQLKVKAFLESDSNRTFQAGFNELSINKNNLTLKDYFLHSLKPSKFGQNKIDVKELSLVELSIEDLLDGKLKAKELVLIDPTVRLLLAKGKAKKSDFSWQKVQQQINKKMDIGQMRINNAKVYVNQEGRKAPFISTDSFYAIISSKSLLRSETLDEMFASENSISMPRLAIRLPNMWIDCRNARYENQSFHADAAQGRSSNGDLRFNIKKFSARDINTAGILTGKDSTWLRLLDIGSGELYLKLPDKKKQPDSSRRKPLRSDLVRTIHAGKLQINIEGNGLSFRTVTDSLSLERLIQNKDFWSWDNLMLAGEKLSFSKNDLKGNTGKYKISNVGKSHINNSQWELDNEHINALLKIPVLQLETNIRNSRDIIPALEKISLREPTIELIIREGVEEKASTKKTAKPLDIPVFELFDPIIHISKENDLGREKIASVDGGRITVNKLHLNGKIVSTNGLDIDLRKIVSHQERFDLQLPSFKVVTGPIDIKPKTPLITQIEKLHLQGGRFELHDSRKTVSFISINAMLEKSFRLNTHKDSLKRLLSSLPNLQLSTGKLLYQKADRTVSVDGLTVESAIKQIRFDSLQWTSNITRDSFFRASGVQKDFMQLRTGAGKITGYEMIPLLVDTAWKISQLQLKGLDLLVERDKRFPTDSVKYRPLLAGMLVNIPLLINAERIDLENAHVRYNEISEKKGKEGSIWFSDLNATIRDVRNYNIGNTDSLRLTARTKLMGKGDLRMSFSESYADSLKGFYMLVRMGKMPFNALEPLLFPLFNLRINKGNVDSLNLRVKANDYLAFGKMEMDYSHLKLSLLKEDGKKRKFLSWLGNTVLRNNNSKTGRIFRERIRNKSTFNYWGKIALSGLLTNLGVQRNKKMEKKYKKEMSTLNLPPSLLAE